MDANYLPCDGIYTDFAGNYYTYKFLAQNGFRFHGYGAEGELNNSYVEAERLLVPCRLALRHNSKLYCLRNQLYGGDDSSVVVIEIK